MVPNPSILGVQMHNTTLHGQPAAKLFDNKKTKIAVSPGKDIVYVGAILA